MILLKLWASPDGKEQETSLRQALMVVPDQYNIEGVRDNCRPTFTNVVVVTEAKLGRITKHDPLTNFRPYRPYFFTREDSQ